MSTDSYEVIHVDGRVTLRRPTRRLMVMVREYMSPLHLYDFCESQNKTVHFKGAINSNVVSRTVFIFSVFFRFCETKRTFQNFLKSSAV